MKKLLYLLSICCWSVGFSQTFTATNEGVFEELHVSYADVGDYDNDSDLDIIIMGLDSSGNFHTKLYDNDGAGNFSLSSFVFTNLYRNGQVRFVDYDHDNDLDIFISGLDLTESPKTSLYKNVNNTFVEVSTNFNVNIFNSQFDWGDLDNDGDLDIVITGTIEPMTTNGYIYRNDGNDQFTEVPSSLKNFSQGKIIIVDFDNDGLNDIVTGGLNDNFEAELYIYKNNGGFQFSLQQQLQGFFNGTLQALDVDDDGWIDLVKSGNISTPGLDSSKIYLNLGSFNFSEYTDVFFPALDNDSVFKGADFNGDNTLDFLLVGPDLHTNPATTYTKLMYTNDGNLNLTENNVSGIAGGFHHAMKLGDFDKDHDIDAFGLNNIVTQTYFNTSAQVNVVPKKPENVSAQIDQNSIIISWDEPLDNTKQLSYNFYIGTAPKTTDVITPMANLDTGYRKIVNIGNAQYKNQITINDLANGTYFYGVQSIDNQYEGSLFSKEKSFTINVLNVEEHELRKAIRFYPNPVDTDIQIKSKVTLDKVMVTNMMGQILKQDMSNSNEIVLDMSQFKKGLYFLTLFSSNKKTTFKILKK